MVAFAMRRGIDLLSILPQAELVTPIERVVMPVAHMGIMNLYPPYRVNNPKDKTAIANGQFILIRREVYDVVGGIERVKDQVVEDREFARIVKSEGHGLYLADGRHLASVRMYTSLPEIWEGWTKNTALSFRGKPGLALFAIFGLLSVNGLPPAVVALAVRAWLTWSNCSSAKSRLPTHARMKPLRGSIAMKPACNTELSSPRLRPASASFCNCVI